MENSIGLLKKLKIELPDDATIPLLYIYLEKKMDLKNICTPVFTAALFTNSQDI